MILLLAQAWSPDLPRYGYALALASRNLNLRLSALVGRIFRLHLVRTTVLLDVLPLGGSRALEVAMSENSKLAVPPDSANDAQPDDTRRRFLRRTAYGAVLAGTGMFVNAVMSATANALGWGPGGGVWKSTAQYRDYPNGPQFCAGCRHFRPPNACAIVEPPISPRGWCRFYQARRAGAYGMGRGTGAGY